ncbi:titin-like [Thunnus thynnus]|uniref:titin-like n=1 Tax=Thunnus thynnus TaxID=8237 RepID=UPI003527F6D8
MLLLYFLLWTAVAANKEPLYGKIGDKAVLTPASVVNPITSIEWKHGPDLAMEWYGGETFSYRHFEDRGSLDTSNGALTITGLTPDDSGSYTVEINNKVTSKTELLVISPVSKPTLSLWCEPEMTYCVLTCNGNTTGAELVTYWWTSGDITWSSTKEHNITKEDDELWFSCAFQNPVSFISSEIVFNPFMEKEPLYGKIGDKAVLTPASVVNPITSIEWKHGPDLAMEWYGGETFSYRHFEDRGLLNISTGALMITGLTPDDSGSYTVEINNKVTSKTELLVISPVSKPTLSLWCEPEMTYCVLTCNGNTTGVELVTYWWTSGVDTWSSTKEHNITKENNELWFSCAFKNPVSSSSSEIVFNPFKQKEPLYVEIGDEAVLTADSVVNLITSIVWKHGPNIAMEWYGDNTTAYRHFKDRGLLDTSNGELTITGLTPDDSGNYTVEINNILSSKTQLLVISPVSKPTLSEWCTGTYCVFTCNGNTTGAEPVTYWWTSGDATWSSTKEHKITMVEKELWLSWFSCAFENPVSNIGSEEVFNPFIRNQLIFMAILLLVVCIIIITFRRKGIINFSREWIKELLKWTFIYMLVCILVVFNFILIFNSNFEGMQELLTRMFIMIAVFGVILVGFIIFFIYFLYKAGAYSATNLKSMIIFIPVLFLDMFNIIINLIYEGRTEDLTWMYILIAVFGVILVGFIIAIYFTFKSGKLYIIWNVMYMMPCMSGLFNIIILMYRAINGALIWMIILTAIFGVILVGFIIAIIYLIYKRIKDGFNTKLRDLKWMLILIAVCIPVVFNIINSLYRAIRGDLTWMIIVTAIFGVILVGFIISIIYLKYRDKLGGLRFTFMLIAVCISGVCNIIINLIYKGRTGNLTWMFNFIPVCMLVGFIIIIIYLIYKGITFFRRKRREREAAERDLQEYLEWKRKGKKN